MLRPLLRLVVGVLIACLMVRTFAFIGWITPLVVEGRSMAPGLPGRHAAALCPLCATETRIGADRGLPAGDVACPACRQPLPRLDDRALRPATTLWVDRASLAWRPLRRWERVVLRHPEDPLRLCVKRVVGLPGERIELQGGDVWADGVRVAKGLDDQLATRQLVHRETTQAARWRANSTRCRLNSRGVWRLDYGAITYRHPGDGVVRDDLAYNHNTRRRLNPVADLMLTADVQPIGDAAWSVEIIAASVRSTFSVDASGAWSLRTNAATDNTQANGQFDLPGASVSVLLSVFDHQALAAIDGRTLATLPLPGRRPRDATPPRIRLRADGGEATVRRLSVWRDIYYEPSPVGRRRPAEAVWQVPADGWFVVGDNQAVSLDSRSWAAGVASRLLIGRVSGG